MDETVDLAWAEVQRWRTEAEDARARIVELENAGRALLEAYEREPPTVYDETADAHNRFRAVLDKGAA